MVRIREEARCSAIRVFLWNETLTRNQISESEALCIFLFRSTYKRVHPWIGGSISQKIGGGRFPVVIPFDKSKLLNKDASLVSTLVSDTLQFLPETVKQLEEHISSVLFTRFDYSQVLLPPPRPTYVVGLEIYHTRFMDFTDIDLNVSPDFKQCPPSPPCFRPFEIDWDEDDEFCTSPVSTEVRVNDPYHCYTDDVWEHLCALRDYAGEAGILPTKPPIAADLPRGFVEIQPSYTPNVFLKDILTDDICPICHEGFNDVKEVTITPCFHAFHIMCLLPWICVMDNKTCPMCRAVYAWECDTLSDEDLALLEKC